MRQLQLQKDAVAENSKGIVGPPALWLRSADRWNLKLFHESGASRLATEQSMTPQALPPSKYRSRDTAIVSSGIITLHHPDPDHDIDTSTSSIKGPSLTHFSNSPSAHSQLHMIIRSICICTTIIILIILIILITRSQPFPSVHIRSCPGI